MKHVPWYRDGMVAFMILPILMGAEILPAQVAVAPAVVFINSKSGVGNLYITNNSAYSQEVSIGFVFGYPDADSAGNAFMNYNDTVAAATYSLDPVVKAYPRNFVLNAKQQQTVRLQVRARSSVKDLFLFSRVKVTSIQKSPPVEEKPTEEVKTQIRMKFNQVFPVFYRKGNVSTGLVVHDIRTTVKDKKLTIVADVERTGAAPFIGSVKAELFSPANGRVALSEATTAIYFRMKNAMELDLSKAEKGDHRLVLTFETKRSDIAMEDLLKTPPVTKEVTVNVQ